MTKAELLEMTKMNLQLLPQQKQYDKYIGQLIEAAKKGIIREGVQTLSTDEIDDCHLIAMYAAYLYRARNYIAPTADSSNNKYFATTSNNAGQMPRMLRRALNDRIMEEKIERGGSDDGRRYGDDLQAGGYQRRRYDAETGSAPGCCHDVRKSYHRI